jgi:hypothetical protein
MAVLHAVDHKNVTVHAMDSSNLEQYNEANYMTLICVYCIFKDGQ